MWNDARALLASLVPTGLSEAHTPLTCCGDLLRPGTSCQLSSLVGREGVVLQEMGLVGSSRSRTLPTLWEPAYVAGRYRLVRQDQVLVTHDLRVVFLGESLWPVSGLNAEDSI